MDKRGRIRKKTRVKYPLALNHFKWWWQMFGWRQYGNDFTEVDTADHGRRRSPTYLPSWPTVRAVLPRRR